MYPRLLTVEQYLRQQVDELKSDKAKLLAVLEKAQAHLEFCGYGDSYESEGAYNQKLPELIEDALACAESA